MTKTVEQEQVVEFILNQVLIRRSEWNPKNSMLQKSKGFIDWSCCTIIQLYVWALQAIAFIKTKNISVIRIFVNKFDFLHSWPVDRGAVKCEVLFLFVILYILLS